mgnify:CR=1 FL=1
MTPSLADMKSVLARVADGHTLNESDAESAFDIIMSGDATPAQIGALLMALRVRGETVEEITGAVRAMRAKALMIKAPADAIDIVGTGGDAKGTFNISTAAAFVTAGAGVPVAKHGNRAVSSKSGASDVLSALGVNLDADMALVEKAVASAGICFLMAPRHHSAMRHVAGPRGELGVRTIFNILGPMSNPAGARRQLSGAFDRQWIEPMARTLANLGSEAAWLVHGSDGLDELTTTGPSYVAELKDGAISTFEIHPGDAGLPQAEHHDLRGGDAGPLRDVVLFNAAAALLVAGKVGDIKDGVKLAAESIDSGRARTALKELVAITNEEAEAE